MRLLEKKISKKKNSSITVHIWYYTCYLSPGDTYNFKPNEPPFSSVLSHVAMASSPARLSACYAQVVRMPSCLIRIVKAGRGQSASSHV